MDLIIAHVQDLASLSNQLEAAAMRLSPAGSLVLRVNALDAYEAKPVADSHFKKERSFRNEIVWTVFGAARARARHSTLFWYVRDAKLAPFTELAMPRSRATIERFGDGRIRSGVNPQTKKRTPARIEGASLATALNDVWVWDEDCGTWLADLDEMSGASYPRTGLTVKSRSPEQALHERLVQCAGSPRPEAVSFESW